MKSARNKKIYLEKRTSIAQTLLKAKIKGKGDYWVPKCSQ